MYNFSKICHEISNITRDCSEIFKAITHCNSDFVNHATISANPFTICTDNIAFISYRLTMYFYNKLFTTHDPQKPNSFCAEDFLNTNRIDAFKKIISNSKDLWESANCDACYDNLTSTVQNFSRNTKELFNLQSVYDECVKNSTKNSDNHSMICTQCDTRYQTLNSLYEQLKKSSAKNVCFDLEDMMNKTRHDWSGKYKCSTTRESSLTAFYSLATVVYTIAIGFYGSVYYIGIKNRTLNQTDTSSNNVESTASTQEPEASSSSSAPVDKQLTKAKNTLSINSDDSDDDEILIGGGTNTSQPQELIAFNS